MTIPITNISLSLINTELGLSSNSALSIGNSLVRVLAGKASGAVSYSDLKNKSSRKSISLTVNASTYGYNVYSSASATGNYVAGSSDIVVTIGVGVYISGVGGISGTPAISVSGFSTGDTVRINNYGQINGAGGGGGYGGTLYVTLSSNGNQGGTAILLGFATTINNQGTIAGGGGGGAGGNLLNYSTLSKSPTTYYIAGGGGGGGGGSIPGGTGGGGGNGGSGNGTAGTAGTAGGYLTGGAGGAAGNYNGISGLNGGAGGDLGAAGSNTQDHVYATGTIAGAVGGAGGYYISGGSYATWAATGTRLGLAG